MLTIVSWTKENTLNFPPDKDEAYRVHPDDFDTNAYLDVERGYLGEDNYAVFTCNTLYFYALRAHIREFNQSGRPIKARWKHYDAEGDMHIEIIDEDGRIESWPEGNPYDIFEKFLVRLL